VYSICEQRFILGVDRDRLGLVEGEARIVGAAPPTFDPCLVELGLALTSGGSLVVMSSRVRRMPRVLMRVIRAAEATHFMATPSLFASLAYQDRDDIIHGRTSIQEIVLGGEPFPLRLIQSHLQEDTVSGSLTESSLKRGRVMHTVRFWNIYGTTECSVWATLGQVRPREEKAVSLGAPLAGVSLSVRDEHGREIESGIGELYIGGRWCIVDDETVIPA
jgi:acyl-CoA synthetase